MVRRCESFVTSSLYFHALLGGFFLYRIFFLLFFRLDGYERLNEALMDIAFFLQ